MGTVLSGNRSSRNGRLTVESLPCVRLNKATLYTFKRRGGPLLVVYDGWATVTHGFREWTVVVEQTPLHYGGHRRWLVCNCCGLRRSALYVRSDRLECRYCLDLCYSSQNENQRMRWIKRAEKLRERLGWIPGVFMPLGRKPPRMHWKTYYRLTNELDALTNALLGNVSKWLDGSEACLPRRNDTR